MTATATKALTLATRFVEAMAESDLDGEGFDIGHEHYSANDLRLEITAALNSLRQGPQQIHALGLHRKLIEAVAQHHLAHVQIEAREALWSIVAAENIAEKWADRHHLRVKTH